MPLPTSLLHPELASSAFNLPPITFNLPPTTFNLSPPFSHLPPPSFCRCTGLLLNYSRSLRGVEKVAFFPVFLKHHFLTK
ncbi:hypothetical protein E2C01_040474 [Portunus trituberculatus]|uniref:Uncharacterized protein n=1 Tax=Portunus trituberculatus TaxID=210409 RepID=A0A5B7FPB0_PORTR|nr:hypothetical protein [Portunus trituberculatus]